MIFKRDIGLIAYPVKTPFMLGFEAGVRIQEMNIRTQLIVPALNNGYGSLTGGQSSIISLPDGYTNTQVLFFMLRTNGDLEITVTSPEHASSKNYLYGTSACPALFVRQSKVTSITIANPTASPSGVFYSWVAVTLPDLSLNSSYQGMSSDGNVYLS